MCLYANCLDIQIGCRETEILMKKENEKKEKRKTKS